MSPVKKLILFNCTLLVLVAYVGRSEAKVHEEDNDKAIDDKHSGELADISPKMRRSVELSPGHLERLFKRASDDGADAEEKPHKGKKKKRNGSTTTTSAPATSSKAPAAASTTDKPAGSTTKAPSGGDKSTTTTTGKPGSTTAGGAATTTTPKPTISPKMQDSADLIKNQEDEANLITTLENTLTSWDKWLLDHRQTLNRHFALEVYHHMRRTMLQQGLDHPKYQKPIMISGPPMSFIQDGDKTIQRNPYAPTVGFRSRNRILF